MNHHSNEKNEWKTETTCPLFNCLIRYKNFHSFTTIQIYKTFNVMMISLLSILQVSSLHVSSIYCQGYTLQVAAAILLLIMRGHIYIYISIFVCPVVDTTLLYVCAMWLIIFY